MKHRKFFLKLIVIFFSMLVVCLISHRVNAEDEIYYVNEAKTVTATLTKEGDFLIEGEGIVGEGIDKIREVGSYEKDVGENNITEDSNIIISEFWNQEEMDIEMSDIKRVLIGDGVTGIENDFFSQCDNITSITLSSTVTYIGEKAFHYLYGLQEINVDESNPVFSSENGVLLNKDKTQLICYPKGKEDSQYKIPDTVTSIQKLAFSNNTWIENLEIPQTVTQIETSAFRSCNSLKAINVAEENPNYSSNEGILLNKDKTELIWYPSKKEDKSYVVPETVKTIKEYAFSNSYYLEQIDISTADILERGTFYASRILQTVKLPETVSQMGTAIFSGCYELKHVTLPAGITKIEACTFTDCTFLQEVSFPSGIVEIGDYAFTGCISMKEFAVPIGTVKLGKEVFQNCYAMEQLYLPNTITEITSLGEEVKNATIYCKSETEAEKYLKQAGYAYVIDDTVPIIMMTYSTLERTNEPVEVTIRTIEKVIPIAGWNSVLQGILFTKSYEQNTEETVTLTDLVGNQVQVNISVENIDNEAPQVVVTYQKQEEGTGVQVTIFANEELQELEGWTLSEDKREMVKQYESIKAEEIVVRDLAGNEKKVTIEAVDFVADVQYSSKEANQEKVVVTIVAERELQELEGWTLSEDKKTLTREFTENVKWAVTIADIEGNMTTVKVEVDNIDNIPPEMTVKYSTTDPTNEEILVTLVSNEPLQELEGWKLSENKLELTKTYQQNIEEEIEVKDLLGNTAKVTVKIENYDVTPANIQVSYHKLEDTSVEVILTSDEALQELEGWTLSEDKKELTKSYAQKESEEVIVKDLAGNETAVSIEIGDLMVSVGYSTTQMTKENVEVTIQSDVALQELEGWTLSEDKLTLTKIYEQNTIEFLTIKDLQQNEVVVKIQIDNIDKIGPELMVEYSEENLTNQDVVVTITTNEPVQELEGWTLREDGQQLTKTYVENVTEEVILKDLSGNESKAFIQIGNIDKKPPEVKISYEKKYHDAETQSGEYETIVTIMADEVIQEVEGWTLSADHQSLTKTFEEDEQELVEVRDMLGNVTKVQIVIGELELEVQYHKIGSPLIEEVVVSIISNCELKPLEGWELSEDKKTLTKSFSENVNTYITVEDMKGNISYVEVFIKDIGESVLRGDITQDGKIDITDLLLLLRHIAAMKDEEIANKYIDWILQDDALYCADANADEKVDLADVLKIQRHIAAEKSEQVGQKHPEWIITNEIS